MKQKWTRLLALVLAAVMLAGCMHASTATDPMADPNGQQSQQPEAEQPKEPAVLRVAYEAAETLNPYSTQSLQNYYIAQLLYDPLYRVDEDYRTEKCLIQSLSMAVDQVVEEDMVYETAVATIRIKPGVKFWDGTELTAADVVYSLQQAQGSPYFAAGLSHISWAEIDYDDPLQFFVRLTRPDAFFEKSLTFPVVKAGTGNNNRPVGSGRFFPAGSNSLAPNTDHQTRVENIASVELVNIADMGSAAYSIKTGIIDLACSDLRTPWNRSLGNGFTTMQLSNMVYLGVNKAGTLGNAELRQTIYRLLNRSGIDSVVYLGQDTTSWMPFNPAAHEIASSAITLPSQLSTTTAGQLLDQIGCSQRDQNGYRTLYGNRISLTILVNNENSDRMAVAEAVAQSLEEVGLRAVVESCPFEEYQYRLAENSYDLFVGEIKLPMNMNILPMLTGADGTGYGAFGSENLQYSARHFLRTGNDYDQLVQLFAQEVPFIPLFYRQGIVAYPLNFCSNIIATEQDIFYNIEDWVLS